MLLLGLTGLTLADGRFVGTNGTAGGQPSPAQNVRGAGILSLGGKVVLNGCTMSNCYLKGGNAGTNQSLSSTNVTQGGNAIGAAVYSLGGQLNVTNCIFTSNSVLAGGGSDVPI